jgi:hypothetical protein
MSQEVSEQQITFGEGFRSLEQSTYPLLVVLLCVPFIQPISLGPLATVGGLSLAALGWQFAHGRETPWLPRRLERMEVSQTTWNKLLSLANSILSFSKRFTRPRLEWLIARQGGQSMVGGLICVAGLLMAIPFVGIPLNNTFPALMALCAALAPLERDGLMVALSLFWLVVTVVYFGLILGGMWLLGTEAIWPYIQQFFQ